MSNFNEVSDSLERHYRNKFMEHGPTSEGVDWGTNEKAVEIRHSVMHKIIQKKKCSILDVGCGYGAFYEYLLNKNLDFEYTGLDLVEEMIDYSSAKHTACSFIKGDILDLEIEKKDYIICNGILTQKLGCSQLEMWEFVKKVILKMWSIADEAIAFNIMSTNVNFFSENLFYKSPTELLAWVNQEITNSFSIIHSYPLYEYTVYLYKSKSYLQE